MTFRTAYLKLTVFYVLIIMVISLLFSVWVYNEATRELQIGLRAKFDQFGQTLITPDVDQFVREGRMRVAFNLFVLNVLVLGAGAATSYFLARRTMQPIEEAMEAKDRFTADASHELRTPLATMKAEIEVALRDKKRSKTETDQLLYSNLEEIDRLGSLAEGLLVLTNEEKSPQLSSVRIDKLLRAVCARFAVFAQTKNVTLTCNADAYTVLSDTVQLEKVVGILIDNAIKYSPPASEVTITTGIDDDKVVVAVADHGYGIKASDLPHIFDRFYRADASRSKERVAGHGLGLSIARSLAASFDATITVKSVLGKGSVFSVVLPSLGK
jgi:signal transduction histidine kinase